MGVVNLLNTHTVCQSGGMLTLSATTKYKNHRFPAEIMSHAVWLYFRFCLSFRDVEELIFERDISVTYEVLRKWCRKFGQRYANQLRQRRPRPGDRTTRPEPRVAHPAFSLCGAACLRTEARTTRGNKVASRRPCAVIVKNAA